MMWWSVWCFAVVACSACVQCAPAASGLSPADWREVEEDIYAVAPVGGRSAAPWMYYLGEDPHDAQGDRRKRRMPTLSIELPMSVIRQRLSQEKVRKEHALQAAANRNFLNDIGKRGIWNPSVDVEKYN